MIRYIYAVAVCLLAYGTSITAGWGEGTLIQTADDVQTIQSLEVGSLIWTCTNLSIAPAHIIAHQLYTGPACHFTTILGSEFVAHVDQLVYSLDQNAWVTIRDLAPGTALATQYGHTIVKSIEQDACACVLYRLSIDPHESYLVGHEGIWAHNEAFTIAGTTSLSGPTHVLTAVPPQVKAGIAIGTALIAMGKWIFSAFTSWSAEQAYKQRVLEWVKKKQRPPLICTCPCHLEPVRPAHYTCEYCRDNIKLHPYGWFQASPSHPPIGQPATFYGKSPGPTNLIGQILLDCMSFSHPTLENGRISFDPVVGKILVFSYTSHRIFHGHYEEWHQVIQNAQKKIKDLFGLNDKGNPK